MYVLFNIRAITVWIRLSLLRMMDMGDFSIKFLTVWNQYGTVFGLENCFSYA